MTAAQLVASGKTIRASDHLTPRPVMSVSGVVLLVLVGSLWLGKTKIYRVAVTVTLDSYSVARRHVRPVTGSVTICKQYSDMPPPPNGMFKLYLGLIRFSLFVLLSHSALFFSRPGDIKERPDSSQSLRHSPNTSLW